MQYEGICYELAVSFQDMATQFSFLDGKTLVWCLWYSLSVGILWNLHFSVALRIDVISESTAHV